MKDAFVVGDNPKHAKATELLREILGILDPIIDPNAACAVLCNALVARAKAGGYTRSAMLANVALVFDNMMVEPMPAKEVQ